MKRYTLEEIKVALATGQKDAILSYDKERVLASPILAPRLDDIEKRAAVLREKPTVPPPFSTFKRFEIDGNRSEYERVYFNRRQRLEAFAILSWLYGRDEDISDLEDIIWAILDEYTWALPAHLWGTGLTKLQQDGHIVDLFAAETASALAEILVLVGDKLHPIVVERTRRLIRERVLDRMNEKFHWMTGSNNWVAVCGGSVGIAAMYELDDDALAPILYTVLNSLHGYLGGFTDDGVCLEGIAYWRYGFGYFMAFAELLYRRTAGVIDLFDDEKVHRIAAFVQKCLFTGGRCVSFSDSLTKATISLFAAAKLTELYPDIVPPSRETVNLHYPEDGCARFALELRNLVWAPDVLESRPTPPATYIFEDAGWYISTSEGGTSLAAKAGHNGEPHNHNDVGSFEIYKNGEELLADIGCGKYDKDYFVTAKRYTYLCNASYGHSLPIINGVYQSYGREFSARDVKIDTTGIKMDICGAYEIPTLESLVRDIRFDTVSGVTTLTDTYSFTEVPDTVVERFIACTVPKVGEGSVIIQSGREELSITYPDTVTPTVTEYDFYTHRGEWAKVYAIDLAVTFPEKQITLKFEMR